MRRRDVRTELVLANCRLRNDQRTRRCRRVPHSVFLLLSADLPTIVADAYTNADARCPEADAGTRTVIPVTIGTALDVSLARCVIVRVPNDHAAAAASAIASSLIITDHPHSLHERQVRTCVFAARIDVGSVCCAAGKYRAGARYQRDYNSPQIELQRGELPGFTGAGPASTC